MVLTVGIGKCESQKRDRVGEVVSAKEGFLEEVAGDQSLEGPAERRDPGIPSAGRTGRSFPPPKGFSALPGSPFPPRATFRQPARLRFPALTSAGDDLSAEEAAGAGAGAGRGTSG